MSELTATPPARSGAGAYHEPEPAREARSIIVGSRLLLGANASVQLSFLFAFMYLRSNNFGGGWMITTNGPVVAPPGVQGVVIQVLQVLSLAVLAVAARGAMTRRDIPAGAIIGALVLGLAGLGARIYQLLHTGWTINKGTYADVSVLWFAVIAAFVLIGLIWMLKVMTNRRLRDPVETAADVRAVTEYWGFMTATSILVAALVQFIY